MPAQKTSTLTTAMAPSTMPAVTPAFGTTNRKSATLIAHEIASTMSHSPTWKDPSSL